MSFDNRAADSQPHPDAVRFCRKERAKNAISLHTKASARVAYRNQYVPEFVDSRLNPKYARPTSYRSHSLCAIPEQIQQYLLQLDAIAHHLRERVCQVAFKQDFVLRKLAIR